jgi:Retroviral aspartyl protease.
VGLIIKKLQVFGDKGRKRVEVLFDTGASASFIRRDIAESLATVLKLPTPEVYTLGDGVGRLRATETAILYVKIKGIRVSDNFIVVPKLSDEILIGANTLQKWRVKLDLENEDVLIDRGIGPAPSRLRLPLSHPALPALTARPLLWG